MKIVKQISIVIIALLLTSCEEVITVDLETVAPKLVIDASINWLRNTTGNEQKIILSTTTGYYSSEFPTVSGATITVTNSANIVFNFTESTTSGEYICDNFQPVIGETYVLSITLNGETFSATETLIGTPSIEDNIAQNNSGGFTGNEVEIRFSYQDNATQENYYINSIATSYIAFPEFEIEDDKLNQGNLVTEFYSNENLKTGDNVAIKLYGVSKRYYDYFNKLLATSGINDGPFVTIPSIVRGNIINRTNPKNLAFGYFRLSEYDSKNYIVK